MECNFPMCTRHAESNGMCIGHRGYANSVSVKVVKAIPKESDKEKELKKSRKKNYQEFLIKHPFCMAKFSKDCQKEATVIHHLKGRTPAVVDDQRYWLACCPVCNNEIETNHGMAEKLGLKIPRHQVEQSFTIGAHNLPHVCGITPDPDPEVTDGQVLVIEYSKTRASLKKLLERIQDDPNKYFYISKSGYEKKQIPLDKVAPLFKDFLMIVNCSLPQEFIDYLI